MDKKCITRLTAQTIHFLSITQPENNLSVSINFCRCFLTGSLYIQSFSFVLCGYPQITLRAVPAFVILPKVTTLPQIKSGEARRIKKSSQRFSWCTSVSVSSEELREGSWSYRFLRWCRKCCCLSVASSALFCIAFSKVLYTLVL